MLLKRNKTRISQKNNRSYTSWTFYASRRICTSTVGSSCPRLEPLPDSCSSRKVPRFPVKDVWDAESCLARHPTELTRILQLLSVKSKNEHPQIADLTLEKMDKKRRSGIYATRINACAKGAVNGCLLKLKWTDKNLN